MKKFKKILSAVSAGVLCALPAMNGVAVNAANSSEKLNTYVIYCDVETKSGVMWADLEFTYDVHVSDMKVEVGDFGGNVTQAKVQMATGGTSYCASFRAPGAIADAGVLFKVKALSSEDFKKSQSVMRTAAFDSNHKYIGLDKYTAVTVLVGDVNNDNHVTLADATLIMQALSNPDAYKLSDYGKKAADTNLDGGVTASDALRIQEYVNGSISHF